MAWRAKDSSLIHHLRLCKGSDNAQGVREGEITALDGKYGVSYLTVNVGSCVCLCDIFGKSVKSFSRVEPP